MDIVDDAKLERFKQIKEQYEELCSIRGQLISTVWRALAAEREVERLSKEVWALKMRVRGRTG